MLNYFTLNNFTGIDSAAAGHCLCLGTCLLLPENREKQFAYHPDIQGGTAHNYYTFRCKLSGTSHRRKSCGFHHELGCGCGHHYLPAGNS